MNATERCRQEQHLAELFTRQREANERDDRGGADALFRQIWAVLDPEAPGSRP